MRSGTRSHCHLSTVSIFAAFWPDVYETSLFILMFFTESCQSQKGEIKSAKTINYANVGFLLAAPVGSCTGTGDAVWHWHPGTYAGVGWSHNSSPRVVSPSSGYRVAVHSSQLSVQTLSAQSGPGRLHGPRSSSRAGQAAQAATLVLHWTLTSAQPAPARGRRAEKYTGYTSQDSTICKHAQTPF